MKQLALIVRRLSLGVGATLLAGNLAWAGEMTLTSGDFKDGDTLANEQVFNSFGCEGENLSPSLSWSGAPEGTKSLVLTMYDPDAPTGSGWWHWVVVNIPPDTTSLPKGAGAGDDSQLPAGAFQVRTDFGGPGYGGPCPPEGHHVHHYIFTIHAIDLESLDVTADSSAALVGYFLNFHTIGEATIIGLYER